MPIGDTGRRDLTRDATGERRPKFDRQAPEARRRRLIEATLRCAAEGGEGLSARSIAAEAGVSLGLINHYYDSKDALVADAYLAAAGDLRAALKDEVDRAPADDPRARISAFLHASFSERVLNPQVLNLWIVFWRLSRRSPQVQEAHDRTYGDYRALLETLLRDLSGSRPAPFDVRLAAIGLSALLDGLWLEGCLTPATFAPEEGVALCEQWVDDLLAR